MLFPFATVVVSLAAGAGKINFLSPGVSSRPNIFYSDPLQAQAASDAEMDMEREAAAPKEPQVKPQSFAFPHLHVQKVAKVQAAAKDTVFAHRDVSDESCEALKNEIGALKCHMTSYISGFPEGCECHLVKPCPPFPSDLGFTGLSEGATSLLPRMGDVSVTLCMYWNWRKHDSAAVDEALRDVSLRNAKKLWQNAVDAAQANAAIIGKRLWAMMPVAPPPAPPPDAGPTGPLSLPDVMWEAAIKAQTG